MSRAEIVIHIVLLAIVFVLITTSVIFENVTLMLIAWVLAAGGWGYTYKRQKDIMREIKREGETTK